jgi:hypothetical protein
MAKVVADMHFVARRLQLDPHRRKRHLEHNLETICLGLDMRHQTTKALAAKRETCEELRDALLDELHPVAARYFATFNASSETAAAAAAPADGAEDKLAAAWAAGRATPIASLADATEAICVVATDFCRPPNDTDGGKKRKKKKKKKQKKGKS